MKYVIYAFAFCIMFVPAIVDAQSGGLVTCEGPDCNWCTFVDMINLLIDWLVIFLSVIAVIVMVIAGFKMVTSGGDTEAWASGKRMFTSVIIGIIIVLAGWMIIDVLLRTLTTTGGINDWIPEDCGGQLPPITTPGTGSGGGGGLTAVDGTQYTDTEARAILDGSGITVWESAPGRTQLEGVNQATIDEVVRIQQQCGCAVTVTGGTESGHADGTYSHANGYKIDIDDTPDVNSYITSSYTQSGTRSDGATLYTNGSIEYAREGDHWDITVR